MKFASPTDLCRQNETAIRNAFASVGQARVADMIGVSESTVSRYVATELSRVAAILAALNLEVDTAGQERIDPAEHHAIATIALANLQRIVDKGPR